MRGKKMPEYYQEETVSREFDFKDKAGTLMDPDSISIKIIDPSGMTVATLAIGDLTKLAVGKYEMNYTLPASTPIGMWKIFLEAAKGTFKRKMEYYFEVLEVPA
jgi:uncharacterized protein YfaS (alpha-2-macroglobulin family)